jgi:hypothetical protein
MFMHVCIKDSDDVCHASHRDIDVEKAINNAKSRD